MSISLDGLTLCGDARYHESFWLKFKTLVKLEPEQIIDRAGALTLGRKHQIRI